MNLTSKQTMTKHRIEYFARLFDIDPHWATAIAMTESSLGLKQKSPTGCKGVFQMSSIAMKDLLHSMETVDDDLVDIACGVAFLRLLLKRHGSIEAATLKYCDPADRDFYLTRVREYMQQFQSEKGDTQ